MKTYSVDCTRTTADALDFVDITDDVQAAVDSSGISDGQVTVFSRQDLCSLIINEKESGLLVDIRNALDASGSTDPRARHSLLGSASVTVPLVGGKLSLGTWQRVLLVELEAGRERSVVVHILGE